jgi:hypothetical protein
MRWLERGDTRGDVWIHPLNALLSVCTCTIARSYSGGAVFGVALAALPSVGPRCRTARDKVDAATLPKHNIGADASAGRSFVRQ